MRELVAKRHKIDYNIFHISFDIIQQNSETKI